MSEELLALEDIHTYYGESHILEGVSLTVDEGEVVTLIGRNGVGKTTTLRSILQLTQPRDGDIRYRGESIVGLSTHEVTGRGIGWVPEERRVFSELTVAENMFIAVPNGRDAGAEIDRMYDLFPDLEKRQSAKASNLSGGQQQMLAIARALVGNNDLLLLDEPSEGLAPQIVETVADAVRTIRNDVTILLVEQNLPLAMDLSDRFYLLDHGRVVHEGESRLGISEDETIRRRLSA